MTPEAFSELLRTQTDAQILSTCLHDHAVPFAFSQKPATWDAFRDELVSGLNITRDEVRIIGSGRFGFSLRPGRNLHPFNDKSDIDVVIVNPGLFDELWKALLRAAYPRDEIITQIGGWLKKRRNELYTGWITPLDIKLDTTIFGTKARPVVQFNAQWFDTLKKASKHPPRRHEEVNGRLYRTWEHAELYHMHSIGALKRSLDII
jgi:hypothetical protein